MRTNLAPAFLIAVAVLSPAVAAADASDALTGRYEVAFEQVTSNCQGNGVTIDKSTVVISKRAPGIAVEVPKVVTMTGTAARAGRLKAASKAAKTPATALEGKFSIAGTIDDGGKLDAVFVAEFFSGGKPVCTQSWSASGTRVAAAAMAPAAPSAALTVVSAAPAAAMSAAPAAAMFARFQPLD